MNPSSIVFGSVTVGGIRTQSVIVTNASSVAVTLAKTSISGAGFKVSGPVLPLALAAGQTAIFSVNFAPAAAGTYTGSFTVTGTYVLRSYTRLTACSIGLAGTATAGAPPPNPPPPLKIMTTGLPGGIAGTAYSSTLIASGGTPPYKWAVTSGQLPDGLSLVSLTGVISGMPVTAKSYTFNVQVADTAGAGATSSFSLAIGGPATDTNLWSSSFETNDNSAWYYPATGPSGATGGGEYNDGSALSSPSQDHAHSGAWSLKMANPSPSSGDATSMVRWLEPRTYPSLYYSVWYYFPQRYTVPNYWNVFQWISKNSTTGGTDPFFIMNVGNRADGSMYFNLYDWQTNVSYEQAVKNIPVGQWFQVKAFYQCAGDKTGHVTFWQDGVQLFDVPNVQTRYANGDCQWSVDNYSDNLSPIPATFYIDDAAISTNTAVTSIPLAISGGTPPSGTVGVAYNANIAASGGTAPYSWSLVGQLPTGLNLASSSGVISGTPGQAGSFTFTIQVMDGSSVIVSKNYTINIVNPTPLKITGSALPGGTVDAPYSATITASGGKTPYQWSLTSGQLPNGVTLNSSTGAISGTPTTAGPYLFDIQVTDAAGANAPASLSVTIAASTPTPPSTGSVIWKAGVETGSTSEWYYPSTGHFGDYGGGEYDSGIASTAASSAVAHTGSWSAKMTITTPSSPSSGTRMFRWMEPRANRDLYYSVWVYIPTYYTLTGNPANGHYWNLFQFKSRTSSDSQIDPVWAFYIDDDVPGKYYLQAGWGWGGVTLAGPYAGNSVSGKFYTQRIAALPVGQWVHLEAFLHQSNGYDGRLIFWQDGVKLFDFQNVVTSYNNCNFNSWCTANEWAVNLYSDGLTPNPASIYIDDAQISTGFIP
jgi:hypothetical protein